MRPRNDNQNRRWRAVQANMDALLYTITTRYYGWDLDLPLRDHGNKYDGIVAQITYAAGDQAAWLRDENERWDRMSAREYAFYAWQDTVYIKRWRDLARRLLPYHERCVLPLCPRRGVAPHHKYAYEPALFRAIVNLNRELRVRSAFLHYSEWTLMGLTVRDPRLQSLDADLARQNFLSRTQLEVEELDIKYIERWQTAYAAFFTAFEVDVPAVDIIIIDGDDYLNATIALEDIDLHLHPRDPRCLEAFERTHREKIADWNAMLLEDREGRRLHHSSRLWGVAINVRSLNPIREATRRALMNEQQRLDDDMQKAYIEQYKRLWEHHLRDLEATPDWAEQLRDAEAAAYNQNNNVQLFTVAESLLEKRFTRDPIYSFLALFLAELLHNRNGIVPLDIPLLVHRLKLKDFPCPRLKWSATYPLHGYGRRHIHGAGTLAIQLRLSWDAHLVKMGHFGGQWEAMQMTMYLRWLRLHSDPAMDNETLEAARLLFRSEYAEQECLYHALQFVLCMDEVDLWMCDPKNHHYNQPHSLSSELRVARMLAQANDLSLQPIASTDPPVLGPLPQFDKRLVLKTFNAKAARKVRAHLQAIETFLNRGGLCHDWFVLSTINEATKEQMAFAWDAEVETQIDNAALYDFFGCDICACDLHDGTMAHVFNCRNSDGQLLGHGIHVRCAALCTSYDRKRFLENPHISAEHRRLVEIESEDDVHMPNMTGTGVEGRIHTLGVFDSLIVPHNHRTRCMTCQRGFVDKEPFKLVVRNEVRAFKRKWPEWNHPGGPGDTIVSTNRAVLRAHEFRVLRQLQSLYRLRYGESEWDKFTCYCGRFGQGGKALVTFDKYTTEFLQSVLYLDRPNDQLKRRFFCGIHIDNDHLLAALHPKVNDNACTLDEVISFAVSSITATPSVFVARAAITITTFTNDGLLTRDVISTFAQAIQARVAEFNDRFQPLILTDSATKKYLNDGLQYFNNDKFRTLCRAHHADGNITCAAMVALLCDTVDHAPITMFAPSTSIVGVKRAHGTSSSI